MALRIIVAAAVLVFGLLSYSTFSHGVECTPLTECRYIAHTAGEVVKRNAKGEIIRRADVRKEFQLIHPCPSTGMNTGKCPNWEMNHVIPLACGGRDSVSNLQWLRNELKTCAASTGRICVDRYERKISAATPAIPDTANCINEVVP